MCEPEISILVVLSNKRERQIHFTLSSLLSQTLEKYRFKVMVAENPDPESEDRLMPDVCYEKYQHDGLDIDITRLIVNFSQLQASIKLAESCGTQYILFVEPGDVLMEGCLEKLLQAAGGLSKNSWAYPSTINKDKSYAEAPEFNPFNLLSLNRSGIYITENWLNAARKILPVHEQRYYSSLHAAYIRLMVGGGIGVPVKDAVLSPAPSDRAVPTKLILVSAYVTLRSELFVLPLMLHSWSRNRLTRNDRTSNRQKVPPIHVGAPRKSRIKEVYKKIKRLSYMLPFINLRVIYLALFKPDRFVEYFLNPVQAPSIAELLAGFLMKPAHKIESLADKPSHNTIVFAHTNWVIGGAEKVLLDWITAARQLKKIKIIDVCERDRFGEYDEDVRQEFGKLCDKQYNLETSAKRPGRRLDILWDIIKRERPSLIFLSGNSLMYSLLPGIKASMPQTRAVDILHNEWDIKGDWFDVSYEYSDYIDRRVVVSEYWANRLHQYRERMHKIDVFPNSVDMKIFDRTEYNVQEERSRLGLSGNKIIVGFIGRLYEQKSPETFFELAYRMADHDDYHFIVVGDGLKREKLLEQYHGLSNLTYFGPTDEVPRYLSVVDVMLYCSRFEGFPIASLEAAAMAKPIIAPDIIGFREQVNAGKFGILYQPGGNISQDVEVISNILLNRLQELRNMGGNGTQFIKSFHDKSSHKLQHQNYLARLMDASGPPDRPKSIRKNKKRLFLHIGVPKTGSTSIQKFCYINARRLGDKGLCYPELIVGQYNHHPLAWSYLRDDIPQPEVMGSVLGSRSLWRDKVKYFIDQLTLVTQDNILISSEMLSVCDWGEVSGLLSGFDVKIIVFIRRQDLWAESMYNQEIKMSYKEHGHDANGYLKRIKNDSVCNYEKLLSVISGYFGSQNIIVAPFEKSFYKHGLEKAFLGLLGIEWDEYFVLPRYKNISLNRDSIEYIKQLPANKPHKMTRSLSALLECYSEMNPDDPKYKMVFSPKQHHEVVKHFEAGNKEVARRYLGREDGQLFRDGAGVDQKVWEEYPGLTESKKTLIKEFLQTQAPPDWI